MQDVGSVALQTSKWSRRRVQLNTVAPIIPLPAQIKLSMSSRAKRSTSPTLDTPDAGRRKTSTTDIGGAAIRKQGRFHLNVNLSVSHDDQDLDLYHTTLEVTLKSTAPTKHSKAMRNIGISSLLRRSEGRLHSPRRSQPHLPRQDPRTSSRWHTTMSCTTTQYQLRHVRLNDGAHFQDNSRVRDHHQE